MVRGQSDVYSYLPNNFDELVYEDQYRVLDSMHRIGDRPYEINVGLFLLGMNLAEGSNDYSGLSKWASVTSRLYGNTGLYSEAYNYALLGLENARKAKSLEYEVQALTRMGRTQMDLQNYEDAIRFAEEAIEKSKKLPDSIAENKGWAYSMAGEIERMSGDYDNAIQRYQSAFRVFEDLKVDAGMEAVTHNMGLAEVGRGNYIVANSLLNAEMDSYIAYDPVRKMEYILAMSELLFKTNQADSAMSMARSGLEFANSIDNLRWKIEFLDAMAQLEREKQNWDVAWDYREEAITISEKVLGEKVRRQSEILDVQFALNHLESENTLLLEQNRNQELYSKGMIAIIILILVIASIVIYSFLRTRSYNRALASRNEKLDAFIQEKDVLMNIMAHDLKAPLHAIGGMMELIGDPETPPAVRKVCLQKTNIALNRGTTLISNLLEMAAVESGQIGVNLSQIRLQSVMEDVIEDNSAQAHQKGISLNMETFGEVHVKTDPVLVGRILNNFLSNAIKYSPKGKAVHVRLREKENGVFIHVQDQGPGLSEDDQTKLFQKFKTLTAKPTAGENSTGLGLALSWALAEKINGEILVESELNFGAVFTLRIPKAS